MTDLGPLGDRAFLAHFTSEDEAARWAETLRGRALPGVVEVVLAYQAAAVFADPDLVDLDQLEFDLRSLEPATERRSPGQLIQLPVLYDGEDLGEVGATLDLSPQEVIARHSGFEYHVFAIGFLPGFPYAGYLPPDLSGLPRRDTPRVHVPAGSVAIAGRQTGVYPIDSPGGWHIIGRTPLRIVDLETVHFPIRAGDRLRFVPIDPEEFARRREELL